SLRSSRVKASPSIPGMLMSTTITSGGFARTISRACMPSSASTTSTGSCLRNSFANPRMVGLSSTIRTVRGKSHLCLHCARIPALPQRFRRWLNLWNQDDFAHNLIVLHGIVGGLRLRERKSLVEHRLELARFEAKKSARGEVSDQPSLLRRGAIAESRAHHREPFREHRAEVEGGFGAAHRRDAADAALQSERGDVCFQVGAADEIEDQIGA